MAMERSESIARMVMWLCFATAFLSLAVQWQINSSMKAEAQLETVGNTTSTQAAMTQQRTNSQSIPVKTLEKRNYGSKSLGNEVLVDLSDRRVYVYRQDTVIASYPIGVGKKGWETPTGSFEVMHMQHNPAWRHPITGKVFPSGSDSPLGERWIGFWTDGRNEIGFHGTPNEDLVGTPVSHGCLRMRNRDVRLLYEQVSMGTTVQVRE
ncbi:MAG: L,D-transpeptidase [Nostocaceae cyanobacterium]|nr:L,D-transpeptidase [Nostocaceae cyanobacterium]